MKKLLGSLFVSLLFLAFTIAPAHAGEAIRCANGINTAIGCVPITSLSGSGGFMSFVLGWGTGVAGGVAFLLMLFAGFQIMTSSGNPQKLQAGKELLGAAISGLLLLIFSAFILRLVGVDILGIFNS
jgi:hypothetical protein